MEEAATDIIKVSLGSLVWSGMVHKSAQDSLIDDPV
jgi:hypothetical protein